MKRIIPFVLVLFAVSACSRNDSNSHHGYQLQNPKEVKLPEHPFFWTYVGDEKETTEVGLYGVRNKMLWFGIFDADSKQSLFEWTDENPIPDYFFAVDHLYGNIEHCRVDRYRIEEKRQTPDKLFQLYPISYYADASEKPERSKHESVFVYGSTVRKVNARACGLLPWYENTALVSFYEDADAYGGYGTLRSYIYSTEGLEFACFEPLIPSLTLFRPVSLKEGVTTRVGESKYAQKMNIETGEVLWQTPILQDLPWGSVIHGFWDEADDGLWTLGYTVTLSDGEHMLMSWVIDIETGDIISEDLSIE